jgi:hypothetical protein
MLPLPARYLATKLAEPLPTNLVEMPLSKKADHESATGW